MSSCTGCPTWSSTSWLKGRPRPGAATFAVLWSGLSVPELGFDRAARVPLERAAETDSVVQRRLVALLADAVVDASGGDEEAAWPTSPSSSPKARAITAALPAATSTATSKASAIR